MKAGEKVDLAEGGRVVKLVQRPGAAGERPEAGSRVRVHYVGKLADGTVFDSSVERKAPFVFTVGVGQVIAGWDRGVASMVRGEKAVLTIAPEYGYGNRAIGPIPANSTLTFEVELLDFDEPGVLQSMLTRMAVALVVVALVFLYLWKTNPELMSGQAVTNAPPH